MGFHVHVLDFDYHDWCSYDSKDPIPTETLEYISMTLIIPKKSKSKNKRRVRIMNEPLIETVIQLKQQILQLKNQNELTRKIGRCWDEIKQIKADIESNNRQIAYNQENIEDFCLDLCSVEFS